MSNDDERKRGNQMSSKGKKKFINRELKRGEQGI